MIIITNVSLVTVIALFIYSVVGFIYDTMKKRCYRN